MPIKKSTNEDLIIEAKTFFEAYKKELGESIRKGKKVVLVNLMIFLQVLQHYLNP